MAESLKHKTIKGVAWSAVERFSVAGVSFLFGLILARLLMPSDYGVIAMLAVFISVAQAFVDSGFSSALIRKPDRTEIDNSTAFYFNIVVGLVCYCILFVSAPLIASFYDTPILTPLTRVLGLCIIFNSLCVVQQALLTVRLDFKTQAKISLLSVMISGPIGIACAYYGMGVWSLAVQSVLAAFLRMFLLWVLAKWRPTERFSKASFHSLFSFGSKLLASGLLDTIYNNLYTIVIGKKFAATDLGLYTRADHFSQFPSVTITGILQRVSFPVLSTIQNEDERLAVNYRKFLRLSGFVVFPLMVGLAAVAEPLIRLLLTDKWIACVPFLQVLCLALMWYPIHAINLNLLQVKGRSDLFLRLEIYKKILGVVMLCITLPLGIMAMCIGRVMISLIALALNTYYTGRLLDLGFWKQMRDLLPTLLNSLLMGILIYIVQGCLSGSLLQLSVGFILGVIYYVVSNYFLQTTEWKEFILIIKRK